MDFPGRVVAAIVAMILIMLFPLQYIAQLNNEDYDMHVDERTKALSDSIRSNGYLDQKMYEDYIDFLDHTGELYDVEIEDIHPVTGQEVTKTDTDTIALTSASNKHELSFLSQPNDCIDCSVTPASSSITLFAAHTHTNTCYEGHRHTSMEGCTFTHAHAHTGSCVQYEAYTWEMRKCSNCGQYWNAFMVRRYWSGSAAVVDYAGIVSTSCTYCGSTVYNGSDTWRDVRYSCGYDTDSNGDGKGEAVPYGVSYNYQRSYPVNTTTKTSYTSGCYNYHIHGTTVATPQQMFDGSYVTSTCKLPKYIELRLGNSPGSGYQVIFETLYSSGAIKFKLTGSSFMATNGYGDIHSVSSIVNLLSSTSNLAQFMWGVNGGSFYPSGTYTYAGTYTSQYLNGTVDFCTLPGNAWYLSCGQVEDTTPDCDRVVTSITATSPNQTIIQGGGIYTTAIATYLDGHTGTVNCSVSGFNTNSIGTQTVTLTYNGLVDNAKTTGNKICTVTVTVNPNKIPSYLTITPSSVTVYDGSQPTYTVVVTYTNGTSKTLASYEYSMSGWTSGPGTKSLTFYYSENGTTSYGTCVITVKPNASYLAITSTPSTVYNGSEPNYYIVVVYEDGSTRVVSVNDCYKVGWTAGAGTKLLTFYYVENSKTVYGTCTVIVKPNLSSIIISPTSCSVDRYTTYLQGIFTVTALMEDGSNKIVTGYTISGLNTSNLGKQTATFSYTENGITKSTTAQVTVTVIHKVCPVCRSIYELTVNDTDPGCPFCSGKITGITATPDYLEVTQGGSLNITVEANYFNGSTKTVTGWTSNYNPNLIGLQTVTVEYGGYAAIITVWVNELTITCPVCGTVYPASNDKCPNCAESVVSITASPDALTVQQYELIDLEVTAKYADGTSKIITEWSIDTSTEKPGNYNATVSYKNVTTTISLTVISATSVQCLICGLIYDASEYPMGCPVCSTTITGIEAYLTSGTKLVQLGSLPSVAVVLIYLDTHRELISEGFTVTNYDPSVLGEQTITITYDIYTCYLDIEVVDGLSSVTCPNGHVYYLNEDGSDPGCPYCTMTEGIVTIYYFDVTYLTEILEIVYLDGIYYFDEGNYITVQATKKDVSLLTNLQNTFFRTSMLGRKRKFTFGGEVIE